MMQLREIRLIGDGVEDAVVTFAPGGNVITGDSDAARATSYAASTSCWARRR